MDTSTPCTPEIDKDALTETVLATVAYRMLLTPAQVAATFSLSTWGTVEDMIHREFSGPYRGYYPKCSMELRAEAVIAEVFDQIAIALEDPRRALRAGAWTPPKGSAGGRTDG